jgi:hypothetical protein
VVPTSLLSHYQRGGKRGVRSTGFSCCFDSINSLWVI